MPLLIYVWLCKCMFVGVHVYPLESVYVRHCVSINCVSLLKTLLCHPCVSMSLSVYVHVLLFMTMCFRVNISVSLCVSGYIFLCLHDHECPFVSVSFQVCPCVLICLHVVSTCSMYILNFPCVSVSLYYFKYITDQSNWVSAQTKIFREFLNLSKIVYSWIMWNIANWEEWYKQFYILGGLLDLIGKPIQSKAKIAKSMFIKYWRHCKYVVFPVLFLGRVFPFENGTSVKIYVFFVE